MEVVYIWIKKCGIYEEQGIHLSDRFRVSFNETSGKLSIYKEKDIECNSRLINSQEVPREKWNINNLVMMVGNNGMGKTTLLKIIGLLNSEGNAEARIKEFCETALIIYYDEKEEKLLYTYISDQFPKRKLDIYSCLEVQEKAGLVSDIKYIYYSGVFANEIEFINNKYDISTMKLLSGKKYTQFFYEELERQLLFYQMYSSLEYLKFDFLDNLFEKTKENINTKVINVEIRKPTLTDSTIGRIRRSNEDRETDMYVWFLKKVHSANVTNLVDHIKRSVIVLFFVDKNYKNGNKILAEGYRYSLVNHLLELEVECILNKRVWSLEGIKLELFKQEWEAEDNVEQIAKLYNLLRTHYNKGKRNTQYFNYDNESPEHMRQSVIYALEHHMTDGKVLNRWLEYILNNSESLDNRVYKIIKYILERGMKDDFVNRNLKSVSLAFEKALFFYPIYQEMVRDTEYDFLAFNWRMSAGEAAVLNFFSRLESIREILPDNVVLLLDEPDLNLHPSLQQEFMAYLYRYINFCYSNKKVSIIIATHSPLLLSDIPKKNIIFFYRDKRNVNSIIDWTHEKFQSMPETFGGNIHSLFYNSFFMENGSIGMHARTVMEDLFDQLYKQEMKNKNYFTDKEIQEVIESMGEPILKRQAELRLKDYNK